MDHGAWILVPGTQDHGSWFPGAALLRCCAAALPGCLDHGAIPWVLLALDPGAWFMVHEPIPWVLLVY